MQKKLYILGAGESGTGAALLAQREGFAVFVSDAGSIAEKYKEMLNQAGIAWEEGQHSQERLLEADEVIKSPGIPQSAPIVQALLAKAVPMLDELEFACRYTEAKIIAITGTNGKTTTTLLTYHLLKEAGLKVGLAGNIGISLARLLAQGNSYDWLVLEVSSFQIDGFHDFQPQVALLLNITADHLNRYNYRIDDYVNAKFRLLQNMSPETLFIYNADELLIQEGIRARSLSMRKQAVSIDPQHLQAAALRGEAAAFNGQDELIVLLEGKSSIQNEEDKDSEEALSLHIPAEALPLKGRHNRLNIACALLAALEAGLEAAQLPALVQSFQGLPHRMQSAGFVDEVEYINDSKATNVDAVFYALEAMTQPVVWIAGGVDKGNDYLQLADLTPKLKLLICLGKDIAKLQEAFQDSIPLILEARSMQEAVEQAHQHAEAGDVVLLSPACASFDLFKSFEDRGEQFIQAVEQLRER